MNYLRRYLRNTRAWNALNYPIYIPTELSEIQDLLIAGNIQGMISALEHRAKLGSGSAAALLAYLKFKGASDGTPDARIASSICLDAARAGDPYAQYVFAWTVWDYSAPGIEWMKRAALQGKFLPALVDLGRFLADVQVRSNADVRDTVKLLWAAHRRGHLMALFAIAAIARTGRLGKARQILSFIGLPVVAMRLWLISFVLQLGPFSERVFVNVPNAKRPLFRVQRHR